jgi:hypothetical protein
MHFQHNREEPFYLQRVLLLCSRVSLCYVCECERLELLGGERIRQLGQPFNVQQSQLHCLGAEQSLIHNHRCIFTAEHKSEEPNS